MTSTEGFLEARDTFERRKAEVALYLGFLFDVVERKPKLKFKDTEADFDRSLIKIMLANGYLLLYNLVESTMTNGVDAIHQRIRSENTEFDALRTELKRIVLRQFRSTNVDKLLQSLGPVRTGIIHCGYNREELFSGNLDAKAIRDVADSYGFQPRHDSERSRGGHRLLEVKTKRNDLAHGKVSFEECGQEASVDRLLQIHTEVVSYLDAVLNAIDNYVRDREYLDPSLRNTRPATPSVPSSDAAPPQPVA
ncbi:MAE_28990/MAE_18760 family HEPN-like nuclease [Azospirillum doebereinerae]